MQNPKLPPVTVPQALIDRARANLDHPVTASELVRIALARLAGADPSEFPVVRGGYRVLVPPTAADQSGNAA
jgi:hypothetical protein